jgi:hypothetical protein
MLLLDQPLIMSFMHINAIWIFKPMLWSLLLLIGLLIVRHWKVPSRVFDVSRKPLKVTQSRYYCVGHNGLELFTTPTSRISHTNKVTDSNGSIRAAQWPRQRR